MQNYLQETPFLDFNHPNFEVFMKQFEVTTEMKDKTDKEIAIALYYFVRDAFIYDPYHLDITYEGLKASKTVTKNRAWCVEKAITLAAALRKYGIPSKLGFAIVTNHIGVERLTAVLRREEIVFHGYVDVFLNDKWIKCTPAFDQRICQLTNVEPLDWDGESDSLFQAFSDDQQFMEYLHYYGDFDDVPIELMNQEMKKYYPHLFEKPHNDRQFSFFHL